MKILLLILFLTSTILSAQKKEKTDEKSKNLFEIIDDSLKQIMAYLKFIRRIRYFIMKFQENY